MSDRSMGKSACAPVRPLPMVTGPSLGDVSDDERERLARDFGSHLRALRNASALTQARLGGLAGIRGDHIGRLERGQRRPTVDAIKTLVRVLVPKAKREAVEQALAHGAGESLREGQERKKRAAENKHRKAALAELEETARKARREVARMQARGLPVHPVLLGLAKSDVVSERLRADLKPEPDLPGITGYQGADAVKPRLTFDRKRRTSIASINAWLDETETTEQD